ncbi:MAG: thioredoxin [Acidimicrobiia bacterium]|nr:thioredoxin [Acidimicrobiia bacterium]
MASENVTLLSDENFSDTIATDGEPVLVDFWAEWCGPCKMIAPILDEIADEQVGSVKIAKLNVDDAPDTARQYEVMSIPTMILFKDGEPVKKIVGAKPKAAILSEIAEFL